MWRCFENKRSSNALLQSWKNTIQCSRLTSDLMRTFGMRCLTNRVWPGPNCLGNFPHKRCLFAEELPFLAMLPGCGRRVVRAVCGASNWSLKRKHSKTLQATQGHPSTGEHWVAREDEKNHIKDGFWGSEAAWLLRHLHKSPPQTIPNPNLHVRSQASMWKWNLRSQWRCVRGQVGVWKKKTQSTNPNEETEAMWKQHHSYSSYSQLL